MGSVSQKNNGNKNIRTDKQKLLALCSGCVILESSAHKRSINPDTPIRFENAINQENSTATTVLYCTSTPEQPLLHVYVT